MVPVTRLLVLSDSHGRRVGMEQAVLREHPDVIYHLGDYYADGEWLRQRFFHIPVFSVAGNCDYGVSGPERIVDELEGVRIFACHGHRYRVKSSLMALKYAAEEQGASLCFFGHTHAPLLTEADSVMFLNPGAAGASYPAYGLVILSAGQAECSLHRLQSEE